jgi:hypothetical protein
MGRRLGLVVLGTMLITIAATTRTSIAQSSPDTTSPSPAPTETTPAPTEPAQTTPQPATPAEPAPPPTTPTEADPSPTNPAPATPSPPSPPAAASPTTPPTAPPSVTIIDTQEARGILGNEVRSAANENMGRIVDVIVDGEGRTRAAIIDFGGFLGVGSRKIAVDWKALRFVPAASKRYGIVLELTRDQVKLAPEVKEGKPIIVLGPSGTLEPLP